jgi:energy-coupling factor transporter ATP-binding protein EcfA2
MTINQEILNFSNSCPKWMRDLIRRIAQQTRLTANDIQEVLVNLKASEGLCPEGNFAALDASHLSGRTSTSHDPTILVSICDVKNANLLAPNQTLPFAVNGMTIIYGYNGSGKTGYGRILRQLCRSRHDNKQPILGNVYGLRTGGPATATVNYRIGKTDCTLQWKDGVASPDELAYISVFDATTAPLYADRQNKIEFLPMGLDVLPALGDACRTLSGTLDTEILALTAKINVPLPAVNSQKHKTFFSKLSPMGAVSGWPSLQDIDTHCIWSPVHDDRLTQLEEKIKKVSEPAQILARNNRLKQATDLLHDRFEQIINQLDAESIQNALDKFEAAKSARMAAAIAARGQFDNDPLPNAPLTKAWRLLYTQAETFNAEQYPGSTFPDTGADRVCLLCQQQYSASASERMARFRAFLEDSSQQESSRRERELADYIQSANSISIPSENDVELPMAQLSEIREDGRTIIDKAKAYCEALLIAKTRLLDSLSGKIEFPSLSEPDITLLADLKATSSSLSDENSSLNQQVQDSSTLTKLVEEHAELLDQKSCHGNQIIYQARLSDLKTSDALKHCKAQCGTDEISRKNTQLRETYLTSDFEKRVKEEVKFIGLDYLPITVQGKTEKGVGYMGVALNKAGRDPSSEILSEGEFRGLALACFFAEIAGIPGHDGIVVDDPVSSLDHLHTTSVAERLVKEAQTRPQVIVFTHDIGFYYELWSAAADAGIPVHRNWIYSGSKSVFGTIASDDGPWQVKSVKERMAVLDSMLISMKSIPNCPPDKHLKQVEGFYTKLRESWERAVEECLFNKVVGRFQAEVKTQALKGVTVTDDDHKTVFFAMKRASEYSGHDRPAGRQPTARTIEQMRGDLDELRKFVKDVNARRLTLESNRISLEISPKATIT